VRPGRDKLSGTVEVDETFVGGEHEGKAWERSTRKELVLVAVEDTNHGMEGYDSNIFPMHRVNT